jgi:hypothetical protein
MLKGSSIAIAHGKLVKRRESISGERSGPIDAKLVFWINA